MRYGLWLCLVAACGSSARRSNDPEDAERAAAREREAAIERMKPPSPFELRDRVAYRSGERCGQGPYRIETDALHAKFGEKLYVYTCGKHAFNGYYRLTTQRTDGRVDHDESAFGFTWDNEACKARDVVAQGGSGGASGGATASTSGRTGVTAAAPTNVQPVALTVVAGELPADCDQTQVINMLWTSTEDHAPLEGHLVIEIWSEQPNDLDGLSFVVERHGVDASMTLERWLAWQKADDDYRAARRANVAQEVAAGRSRYLDDSVKAPPPPPPRAETPPPKPSQHARWIAGYWFYADATFHWIAGMWDVPEADLEQQLTVQAPTPPPPPPARDEPKEPAPARTAVWAPGSWQWNGTIYVWVAGTWRIPPDEQHTWQQATWNVGVGGKAIYVPGGWRVRIKLGR